MNPRDCRNCNTCAHLSLALGGSPLCTVSGPELTRWRIAHKPIGEMPPLKTPDCPGWQEKE